MISRVPVLPCLHVHVLFLCLGSNNFNRERMKPRLIYGTHRSGLGVRIKDTGTAFQTKTTDSLCFQKYFIFNTFEVTNRQKISGYNKVTDGCVFKIGFYSESLKTTKLFFSCDVEMNGKTTEVKD